MVRAGEPLGVLRVMSSEAEHFDDADVEVLELMANLMASGLSNTSKLDREAERALRDPLTGLANRFIFMDRLAHHGYEARRYGRPYGLFLIGLDRFSVVNESLGQEWGDAVLRSVAQGLNTTVRGGDTLARLEGDQFVVLCGNAEQAVVEERLKGRIEGVVAEVDKDLNLKGYTLEASVGVVWSSRSEITAGGAALRGSRLAASSQSPAIGASTPPEPATSDPPARMDARMVEWVHDARYRTRWTTRPSAPTAPRASSRPTLCLTWRTARSSWPRRTRRSRQGPGSLPSRSRTCATPRRRPRRPACR